MNRQRVRSRCGLPESAARLVVVLDRPLPGCLDPGQILRVEPSAADRIVDPVAEPVGEDGVVEIPMSLSLERGKCSWVGIQSDNSAVTGSK